MRRRAFLQLLATSGGGLLLGWRADAQPASRGELGLLGERLAELGPCVRIDADGRIVIGVRTPDMGQGAHTLEARVLAEELGADWSRVEVVALPLLATGRGEPVFPLAPQFTRGSTTARHAWADLRQLGARARWLLRQAAAEKLALPAASLSCADSLVTAPDGRRLGYGELAAAAARLALPREEAPLLAAADYRLLGRSAGDVAAGAMVRGLEQFSIDRWTGDALVAVIARCPWPGGRLAGFDDAACRKVSGVREVLAIRAGESAPDEASSVLADGVAVLAESTWAALRGREALTLEWTPGITAEADDASLARDARARLEEMSGASVIRSDGEPDSLVAPGQRQVEAIYELPLLAHATMEPLACLVRLTPSGIRIEAPTQDPQAALAVVRRLTGLDAERIHIEMPRMGGGFGRRLDSDHIAEAVALARQASRPVKLLWTRADMLRHDRYRPFSAHRLRGWLDRRGRLTGWTHDVAGASAADRDRPPAERWRTELDADALPAGLVEHYRLRWAEVPSPVPCGNWRAPGHNSFVFARESFLDELAHAAGRDPLEFRRALFGEPRLLPRRGAGGPTLDIARLAAVLELAAERIGWRRRLHVDRGLGLAVHAAWGSYCAHAFEVSVARNQLRIHRAICVVDAGRVLNPSGLEAQMIGGTIDGISAALHQRVRLREGRVRDADLRDYRLAGNAELPRKVEVQLVDSAANPGGAGEIGLPGVAPALANAIFDIARVRIRRLPLMPELNRLL